MPPKADMDLESGAVNVVPIPSTTPVDVVRLNASVHGNCSGSKKKKKQGDLGVSLLEDEVSEIEVYNDEISPQKDGIFVTESGKPRDIERKSKSTRYAIFYYYFLHGLSEELPVTALYLVLKEHFHLLPYQYSYIKSLNWIPWTLKPMFGYISDNYPIFGHRRCPYLAIGVLIGLLGWISLASSWIEERWLYLTIMVVNSIATVVSETAVDSLIAEIARTESEENIGYLQSSAWTCNAAGSIVGSLTPIIAFSNGCHPRYILLLNGCIMGMSGLSLPWMHETEFLHDAEQENYMAALKNPLLMKALAFVFIVASSPTSGDAFTYFQTDVLHFSPAYISWTVVIFTTANFSAAYAYAAFLRKRNMRVIFRNVILFILFIGMFNIIVVERWNKAVGIPDKFFILGDFVAQGVAGQLIFMPVAVLAARMSPAGGEGFIYAIAMSVLNISWAFSEFSSGVLIKLFGIESGDYDNMTKLMLTVSALTLIPLLFLHLVPELSKLGGEEEETDSTSMEQPDGPPRHDVHERHPGNLALLDTINPDDQCGMGPEGEYSAQLNCCAVPEGTSSLLKVVKPEEIACCRNQAFVCEEEK